MLVSVTERTEIGLRKALGASEEAILTQFDGGCFTFLGRRTYRGVAGVMVQLRLDSFHLSSQR